MLLEFAGDISVVYKYYVKIEETWTIHRHEWHEHDQYRNIYKHLLFRTFQIPLTS